MSENFETPSILKHTLSNGLTILGEPTLKSHSATIGFFVKTGARDETKKESGVSHFLEHMLFKGTKKRSSFDITYALGDIGAQANASTSEENTIYYSAVIPEFFSDIQEILSDMMRPVLNQEDFDTEKKVIIEEIALYDDRPNFYLFEKSFADYFQDHPAGQSVLGTRESITALTRDEMMSYFERRYSPSNITLVGAGNFDWELFIKNTEKYCGHWEDFSTKRRTDRYIPKDASYKEFKKKNINQSHAILIANGPTAQDPERYPIAILSLILGDGSGSKLYWDIVDKGDAEIAVTENDERDGTGCFLAYTCTEPSKLDSVVKKIRTLLSKPLDFSEDELERAKSKIIAKVVLNGELPMGRLMSIGHGWNYRKEAQPLDEILTKIKAVNREVIEEALKKFPLSNFSEYKLIGEK
jgi:predicted Zn-dependent peptidase